MSNYVDNKKFLEEIIKHRKASKEAILLGKEVPRLNDYIGKVIMQMAENLAKKPRWNRYTWKDEMIEDAIQTCITYFNTFDPEKGQLPFAYFTTVIVNAFQNRCNIEEQRRYTVYKNFFENVENLLIQNHKIDEETMMQLDSIQEFIKSYEARQEDKRLKKQEKKKENQKKGVFSG